MKRWNPEIHDPIFLAHHRQGLTDREIANRMLDAGHAISQQDVGAVRRNFGLRANARPELVYAKDDQRQFKDKPNPLATAKMFLGHRLQEKETGYWLDGRPISLHDIIREYNRIRIQLGQEQITDNPAWRV